MEQQWIQTIAEEVGATLKGRFLGRVFQLSQLSLAIDFGLRGQFLFLSVDPASPRFYLISRSSKEIEKTSIALSHFGQIIRARLGGGELTAVVKDEIDRIVRLSFKVEDELGSTTVRHLIVQLTGKAANLLLVDESGTVTDALRSPKGPGQELGQHYQPPPPTQIESPTSENDHNLQSPSAAMDDYFSRLDAAKAFAARSSQLRAKLQKEIRKREKLQANLQSDLAAHGDPEQHKKLGDLLLANIFTAKRDGQKVILTDYYSPDSKSIEIAIDENTSLQDEAAKQFRQYTKAKRAREEIRNRLETLDRELTQLNLQAAELERLISAQDEEALAQLGKPKTTQPVSAKEVSEPEKIPGVRQYVSSDGYVVWVGRAARDNDNLTFRLARPHDLWLHAGDYPGSHVIVRNPTRKELPQRTIIEAAQLAGHFSQASEDSKVVVHYTERKFLSKPKGAAPGLVRMSSFRSITVEPKESINRR